MQLSMNNVPSPDEARSELLTLQELGKSIRLSLGAVVSEPVPADMGLLLLRLARIEASGSAVDKKEREAVLEALSEE